MKKLMASGLICFFLQINAQNDKTWSFGAQWGFQGNPSTYSGGMEVADATFSHESFGGGSLNLIARFDHDKHWMLMTGVGFNSFGFEYNLSKNYSLVKDCQNESYTRVNFSTMEIPTLIHYKFEPNCKNAKWVLGVGFVETLIGKQVDDQYYTESTEGASNGDYLNSHSQSTRDISCMFRMTIAREKVLKKGGILNASLVLNCGLRDIATSNVEYEVNQKRYQHEFTNKGNYVGFKLAYFLKPFSKGN